MDSLMLFALTILMLSVGDKAMAATRYEIMSVNTPTCATTSYCYGYSSASATITGTANGTSCSSGSANTITYNFLLDGTSFKTGTFTAAGTYSQNATISAAIMSTLAVGTHTVTCTWKNSVANCSGSTSTMTSSALLITIKGPAAITGTTSLCSTGATTTLSDATSGGVWTSSASSIASVSSSGIVTDVATGSAVITYSVSSTGCSQTKTITCATTPTTISGTNTVCATSTFFNESWESGVTSFPVDGWTESGSFNIDAYTAVSDPAISSAAQGTHILDFPSYSVSSATWYLYSPSFSMTGVSGGVVTFYVYRDGTGTYPASGGYTTEGFTCSINTSASITGATTLGFVPRASDGSISGSYISGTSSPGTGTSGWYQYTCTIPASYTGSTNYIIFTAVSQYGNDCYLDAIVGSGFYTPSTTTLTSSPTGGTWSSGTTSVAAIGSSSGIVTAGSSGTSVISYTNACGTATTTVTVKPEPGATISGGATIGAGSTETLTDATSGGTWTSGSTSVATINSATGVLGGIGSGTTTVTYSTGCGTNATTNVIIAAPCTGTPTPGTATISPTAGASTTTFSLGDAGYTTTSTGITLQWYSSTNGITYSSISGATNAAYSAPGITTNTYYVCSVTCTASGMSAGSNTVMASYFPASSCTPAFEYGAGYGYGCEDYMVVGTSGYPMTITSSTATLMTDGTACNTAGYIDETSTSYTCTMNAQTTYSVNTNGNEYGETLSGQVWIDFNNNGTFESSESVGGSSSSWSSVTNTMPITIPSGTTISAGIYRMRVEVVLAGDDYSYPSIPPCPSTSTELYGDVRDYMVTVQVPPTYTVTPASIPFAPTTTGTVSATSGITFNGAFLVPASGSFTVTAPTGFYVSPDGATWSLSYTIPYSASALAATTIYAQFAPTTTTTYSGNITIAGGGITTASVAVTGTGAAPCSGTPTAGTASVSPTSGNSSTSFTLTDAGYSVAGGIGFQWYSSTNGVTYSAISGASNSAYTFTGITQNTYYVCSVTCSASGSTAGSSTVEATYFPASSCTPSFIYTYGCEDYMVVGTSGYPMTITSATATLMTDGTACNSSGYIDETLTGYTCTMNAQTTYSVNTNGNEYGETLSGQVWIDFNNNGTFESSESVGGSSSSWSSVTNTMPITLPSGATISAGTYRMRIEVVYAAEDYSYPSIPPCPSSSSEYYGDVRDYKVTVQVPPIYTVTPASIPFAPTTTGTVSATSGITFNGAFLVPASGSFTVTAPTGFYVSPDGATWSLSYTIPYSASALAATTIYAQFAPTTTTTYSGNITIAGGGITTASVAVTGTGAAPCSGTPTAGTASISPTSGNSSTSFTLTDAGYSVAGGIGFQWYSSTNGVTYSAISGASNSAYTFTGITQNTYYVCSVTCSASGSTAGSSTVEATYFPASSCTPSWYYTYGCEDYMIVCTTGYPFTIKTTGGTTLMSDATACNSAGYIDETSTAYTCTMNAGTSYNAKFSGNEDAETENDQIWIDFNSDGIFQTSESVGGSTSWTAATNTSTITIPAGGTITPGIYRMRVEVEGIYGSYPSLAPCPSGSTSSEQYYGDVRDYKVTIQVPPTYTLTPTSIPFAPTTTGSVSATSAVAFAGIYLVPTSGTFTVTAPTGFYVSPDGATWSSSYTIPYSAATLASTTIYAQFAPTTATTYSGNITVAGGGITTGSVAVTGTGASVCSGVPTAGTASISPSAGAAATAFTLTDAGYSVSGGIGFQWYNSTDGVTYSAISGATNSAYSFTGISVTSYYVCSVTCSASGSTAGTNTVSATFNPTPSCTPTGSSWVSESSYAYGASAFHVTGYSSSTLSDASIQSAISTTTSYAMRYPTIGSVNMQQNGTYPASINWSTVSTDQEAQVWIDFNNDGTFQSSEVVSGSSCVGWSTSGTPNPTTFSISIPITAPAGIHLMRMRADWELESSDLGHAPSNIDPCLETYTGLSLEAYSGTVTDYYVNIVALPPTVVITPASLAFGAVTTSTSSATQTFTVTGYNLTSGSSPLTVTAPTGFMVSPDGSSWASSYTISYTGTSLPATTGYVQFDPTSTIAYSGSVTVTGGGLATAGNLTVTGTGTSPCSGTPTPGTASLSPMSGGTSSVFTLSDAGYTFSGGIAFQWYNSPDGVTYSSISGATNFAYTFTGISANTYYVCSVTCTASGMTAGTNTVEATYLSPSSCTPSFYYPSYGCSDHMIVGTTSYPMTITGTSGTLMSDATACSSTGYIDETLTSYTCTMNANTTYTVTTNGNTTGYALSGQVWIDFNNNGTFESSESVGGLASWSSTTGALPITIPNGYTISAGSYRMRVEVVYAGDDYSYPSIPPCPSSSTEYYGDVRDYLVSVQVPTLYTVTPTSIAFPVTLDGSTATSSVSLNGSFFVPAAGSFTVTAPTGYYVSPDGGTTWESSYAIPYTGGALSATTIPVQFAPTAAATYSGNVTIAGGGITANVAVTGTGGVACTGTPTAGTASLSPSSGNGTTAFSLSDAGYSAATGLNFQWYSSTNGTTYSSISGATNYTYGFTGISANTYYVCSVTCSYSGSTAGTNTVMATFCGDNLSYSSGSLSGPVCSGGTLSLQSGSYTGGTFSWAGPNSFTSTVANPTISGVTTAASGVYTFTGTPTGCTSALTGTMFVAVDGVPTVSVTESAPTICPGGTTTLTATPSPATSTTTYQVSAIPYNFVTLSSPTAGPSGDDVNSGAITLPFSFSYYGTSYSSIYICTNGWASFTYTGTTYVNYSYPSTSAPAASIAFTETDLNTGAGGSISYGTVGSAPNREFVIYFNGVAAYSGSGTVTGEIILHETSNIIDLMIDQSNVVNSEGYAHTFAIQNAAGTAGTAVPGENAAASSVTITTPQGWRFEQPSYTYAWSPATDLSTTTAAATVSSGLAATQIYSVTAIDANSGCTTGGTGTGTVTVVAQPGVTLSGTPSSLCTGGHETLVASPSGGTGTATYTWSGPGITTTTGSTATPAAFTPTVASTTSGAYSVTLAYSGSGCIAATATSSVVTINTKPAITAATPSVTNLCSSGTLSLSATETGGTGAPTFTWTGPGIATTTGSSATVVVTPTVAATTSGVYSVYVSDPGSGCTTSSTVVTATVTVNAQPAVTVTATPSLLCTGGVMTLTATSTGGSGTPSYTWSGPGISTTSGTSASAVYTPSTSTGAYSVSVGYTGGGCTNANGASSSVMVNDQPVASLATSASNLCIGSTETLTASVTDGGAGTPSYTWSGPGITGSVGPYASATYTVAPLAGTSAGAYSVAVSYSVSTGCNTANTSSSVVSFTGQQWNGSASTAWSNSSNWACGSVPTATEDVVIPSSYTNAPTLDISTGYTKSLNIASSAVLTLGTGNQLDVTGANILNSGTVTGAGVLELTGTSLQTLSGNGLVSNLTLANSSGAKINSTSDTVGVTGTLLLSSGTFTTSGTLMLVSNISGTGTIGTVTGGNISGNVIIQQYVPGGRRAFRFVAHPYTSSISLNQIQPYLDITGVGGAVNGFIPTITNAPSAFWYDTRYGNSTLGNDPGWMAYTNTFGTPDSNMFHRYQGIRLFMRGSKGEGLAGTSYTVDPDIYRTFGNVNIGTQTETMTKSSTTGDDYNLLGNPYPSVTDVGTVISNASTSGLITGSGFYIWNPYLGTSGQFVTETIGSAYYMGPNESFEVRTAANGNVLTFNESNKGTVVSDVLMRNASNDYLTLYVYDDTYHPWDILNFSFNSNATDNDDPKFDADKAPSPASLNFYSWSDDKNKLALDARPFTTGKVVPLGIISSYAQDFIIKVNNMAVPAGGQVYLHDKYLRTYTLLQQGSEYKFAITKDPASQGDSRFELGLNPDLVTTAKAELSVQMVPNPANSDVTLTYSAPAKEATSVNVINVEGVTVIAQDLGAQQSGSVKIDVSKLASGVYMVEFISGNNKVSHRLVKE